MNIPRLTQTECIELFLTVWIISTFNNGFVSLFNNIGWLVVFPVWLLVICYHDRLLLPRIVTRGKWILIFFVTITPSVILLENMDITLRSYVGVLVAYIMFEWFQNSEHEKVMKAVAVFYFTEVSCQLLYGLYLMQTDVGFIRGLLGGAREGYENMTRFTPSYAHVYLSILMAVFFLPNIKDIGNKTKKIVIFCFCLASVLFVLRSTLATAFLTIIIFIIMALLIKKERQIWYLLVAFAVVYIGFKELIGEAIVYISRMSYVSDLVGEKIYQLGMYLQGITVYSTSATYLERLGRQNMSISCFFNHPFIGVYGFPQWGTVGGHSTLLDFLGDFGMIRGGAFVCFFIHWYKRCRMIAQTNKMRIGFILTVGAFLFIGYNNPVLKFNIVTFVFAIMPAYMQMMKGEYGAFINNYDGNQPVYIKSI